jgi:hypothetical protein
MPTINRTIRCSSHTPRKFQLIRVDKDQLFSSIEEVILPDFSV